jgi:hypothetical protein
MKSPIGKRIRVIEVMGDANSTLIKIYLNHRARPVRLAWSHATWKLAALAQNVNKAVNCGFGRVRPFLAGAPGWSWWSKVPLEVPDDEETAEG